MASYGYCRVSGGDQNLARQTDALQSYGISPEHIFAAKQSGKDFERAEYKKLLSVLKEGDLVAVLSLDRLGRNYEQILAEREHITRNIKADIIVLDMPLLDARARADTLVKIYCRRGTASAFLCCGERAQQYPVSSGGGHSSGKRARREVRKT